MLVSKRNTLNQEAEMMWYHDMGWGAWMLMSLGMVAFLALVVWLVVTVGRDNRTDKPDTGSELPTASAERVLAHRYARGEIDTEDYHQRLDQLRPSENDKHVTI